MVVGGAPASDLRAVGETTIVPAHARTPVSASAKLPQPRKPTVTPARRLLLVRHGQIRANIERIWHGSTDSPLTVQGVGQAERVARWLRAERADVGRVWCSPLGRTRATAQPIADAFGLPLECDARLVEYGIGELEGQAYEELLEAGFFERIHRQPEWAPPAGEALAQVTARVVEALREIEAAAPAGATVIVGHGAALGLALAHLLDGNALVWQRYHKDNTGVTELCLSPQPELLDFNRTEHLNGG